MSTFHILKGNRVVAKADKLGEAEAYAKKVSGRVLQVAGGARKNPTRAGYPTFGEQLVLDAVAEHGKGSPGVEAAMRIRRFPFKTAKDAKAFADWAQAEAGIPFFWDRERYDVTTNKNDPVAWKVLEPAGQPESALKIIRKREDEERERTRAFYSPEARQARVDAAIEKWKSQRRRTDLDFGEIGEDREALYKWMSDHPGSTAKFTVNGKPFFASEIHFTKVIVPAARKNPSASEHRELGEDDLDQARHNLLLAKDDPRHYGVPALTSAAMAMREGIHAHDREMTAEAMRIHGAASGLLQPRKNGAVPPAETWAEDENEECHDPEFWAGEIIGEVVAAVQAEAKDVYFDPSDGTLQYNGKVATLASTGNGKVIVTTLSFDDDDEMTEHFDRFGPSKSEKDAYAIAKRITGFLLKRKNPSASEHHELGESDLDEARHNLRLAKDDPRHYGIPALSSASMAMREGVHAHDREMTAEAMRVHGEASGLLQSRKNGAAHPAQKWAEGDRKPAIDFGEMGQDRQALAKWLGEHPGKTAAFKAAGTVYHSANIGGQVFTVPASRKNGAKVAK